MILFRGTSRQEAGYSNRSSTSTMRPPHLQTDLTHLVETIAQATSVLQAAGLTTGKTKNAF